MHELGGSLRSSRPLGRRQGQQQLLSRRPPGQHAGSQEAARPASTCRHKQVCRPHWNEYIYSVTCFHQHGAPQTCRCCVAQPPLLAAALGPSWGAPHATNKASAHTFPQTQRKVLRSNSVTDALAGTGCQYWFQIDKMAYTPHLGHISSGPPHRCISAIICTHSWHKCPHI